MVLRLLLINNTGDLRFCKVIDYQYMPIAGRLFVVEMMLTFRIDVVQTRHYHHRGNNTFFTNTTGLP